MLNTHTDKVSTLSLFARKKENSMVENKMRNYKVLASIANDPISSHFSGNKNYYPKALFQRQLCSLYNHTRSQARDLTHRKQTVGLHCMQSKLSWRKLIVFNFDGKMIDRLLLQIRPVA